MSLDFTKVGACGTSHAGPLAKARAKKPRKSLKKTLPEKGDAPMHLLSQRIQAHHDFNKTAGPGMLMRAGKWLTGLFQHTKGAGGKTIREGFFSSPSRAFLGTQASRAAPMSKRVRNAVGMSTAPVSLGISSLFYPWGKPTAQSSLMQPMRQF